MSTINNISDELALNRTQLANTRTLLAFLRTGIMLCATGITLLKIYDETFLHVLGWGLIFVGFAVFIYGVTRSYQLSKLLARFQI